MRKLGRLGQIAHVDARKAAAILGFGAVLTLLGAGGVFGAFSASVSSTGNQFSTSSDLTPPTTQRAVLRKSYGGVAGFAGCGIGGCGAFDSRQFYVYAQVVDQGSPATGISSATTTVGGASNPLSSAGGPWTVDGQTFNYRSGLLTRTPAQLAAGSRTYTVSATDTGGSSGTSNPFNFEVDVTRPQPTKVTLTNAGGDAGPDDGDTAAYLFDSSLDPSSLFGTWSTSGPPVTFANTWSGASAAVRIDLTGPSKYGGVAGDPILMRLYHASLPGNPQMNIGTVRIYSDDWAVLCEARFNGTVSLGSSNTQANLTFGSQITSGQLVIPAPVTPELEVCP